jgi:TRAP-type uncharacterized transport system substrate-binding protein
VVSVWKPRTSEWAVATTGAIRSGFHYPNPTFNNPNPTVLRSTAMNNSTKGNASMKNSRRHILSLAVLSALSASSAFAQVEQLPFATGVDGGTYNTTFDQWKKACPSFGLSVGQISDGTPPKLRNSTGTRENLGLLLGNKVAGGYLQGDSAWRMMQRDPNVKAQLRSLAVLYPEAVHVLALNKPLSVKTTVPGKLFGTNEAIKSVELKSVEDLRGFTVVAWGGSVDTAEIIRDYIIDGQQLTVTRVKDKDAAIAEVMAGKAQAIIAVGGAPVGWVEALTSDWKLLPFPKKLRDKVGTSYADVTLTYSDMGAIGIESGVTPSMLVAQDFGDTPMGHQMTAAFDCLREKLPTIRSTLNSHPVWKKVNLDNQGKILEPYQFFRAGSSTKQSAEPAARAQKK